MITDLSTRHDGRQVIVGPERRFVWFLDDSEWRAETSEAANGQLGCSGDTAPTISFEGRPNQTQLHLQLEELSTLLLVITAHHLD